MRQAAPPEPRRPSRPRKSDEHKNSSAIKTRTRVGCRSYSMKHRNQGWLARSTVTRQWQPIWSDRSTRRWRCKYRNKLLVKAERSMSPCDNIVGSA